MPLYEYQCDACGSRVELIQKFSDLAPDACAKCGKGPMRRLQSAPAIQFKGSGFYITDYARKPQKEPSTSAEKDGKPAEGDAKSKTGTETTSDSSSDSKSTGDASSTPSKPASMPTSPPATSGKDK